MTNILLVKIVLVIALGVGAQWVAWRIRVPSILLLLVLGFLAGPILEFLPPSSLQGDWLFAFVSLAIGIILFEGGLNLRLEELRDVGRAVLNLITLGVVLTCILATIAGYFLLDLPLGVALVIGAILTVTGPTVVLPLLRYVRPTGRVNAIAKWEGITIDPVGAIFAVLVLEAVVVLAGASSGGENGGVMEALLHSLEVLLTTIAVSVGVSVLGASSMVIILRRHLVPDYLQSSVALMLVVAAYALSDVLHEESGLFAATMMGIILANQKYVNVRSITKFKEDLQVLLIACLFILLSARLELDALTYVNRNSIVFLAVLILVVRPIAVLVSCWRSGLSWKEQAFISWLAPRGIVAAAVAALFAARVEEIYGAQAHGVVPIVYMVIVGTVAVYGLTVSPLARRLGLAHPNPQGVLFLGAHLWVQRVASAVQELGFKVLLIDANERNIEQARDNNLPAITADALGEHVIDQLDLGGIQRFFAMTANDDTNSLAALHFTEVFDKREVYQLAAPPPSPTVSQRKTPIHLRGRPLFGAGITHADLLRRYNEGGEIRTYRLTEEGAYQAIEAQFNGDLILLFAARGTSLLVNSEDAPITPQMGDTVIVILPPYDKGQEPTNGAMYDELQARARVLDFKGDVTIDEITRKVSNLMAQRLPVPASRLRPGLSESLQSDGALIAPGIALPHMRVEKTKHSELVLVRCTPPILVNEDLEPVTAFVFLVGPEDFPGQHLRVLAHLAGRLGERSFLAAWQDAENKEDLRNALRDQELQSAH